MKMLLQTRFLSSVQHTLFVFSPILVKPTFRIAVRSQKSSSDSSSDDDSAPKGFGLSDTASTANARKNQKQKQKGQRERASVIRRTPLEKPNFASEEQKGKPQEEGKNESAFLLAMLGFGIVIFVEGIGLAASGFLPEEWDKIFVKYLYPSFTPEVFLFVAGTVSYGVFKYLQNEKITEQK
ncbi:hypothetical protein PHAVU_011G004500 [Phaseolus vulgaris]|uniref:Protein LOW PSII ACCUMULATION 2, chloroplastic n=1 Tax=Phaseolus vulgaris TaxID=3885 RepID=V7ACS7_PHAVU|nr:hypothetical protein PHAVU_011G004500g [Phaseolus vulgaris]ESW03322.1 hypothetical protein PHAVU_011G004500g [Phaseolus vulgaris]